MGNRVIWNDGWDFVKTPFGSGISEIDSFDGWLQVRLPHDWLIYQCNNLYEDGTGFYRKRFNLNKEESRCYEIYFEGVYMDTTLYINGNEAGIWKYGYSSFYFDITKWLVDGDNEVVVKIDFKSPNSRWYSGAGIYRNVWLTDFNKQHFVTDSIYINPRPSWINSESKAFTIGSDEDLGKLSEKMENSVWNVPVSVEVNCDAEDYSVQFIIFREGCDTILAQCDMPVSSSVVSAVLSLDNPMLWNTDSPSLYTCVVKLNKNGETVDTLKSRFGLRHLYFDYNRGLFLNGRHIKIKGACEHHDLGCLGAAFNKNALRRRFEILRDYGLNAVRTAHNMPAPEFLELADEMGFLVMDEIFDMWELSKTEFDYARFFKQWYKKDVASWIRRDRNHPSVILWSIGNEIYDTHVSERGQEVTRMLRDEALIHDPYGNAPVVMGSNYMQWEGAQKCTDILKFAGYNYAERLYDEHHKAHPDWIIFGSETSSTLQSRGIYHFPYRQPILADCDEQCSSLGNCTTSWGAVNTEYPISQDRDRQFSFGQFIWSGFDYIGEPTPYQTRSCYFGQFDTAGFPKDSAYIYRAGWTDYREKPFVHIFPYWDFNNGQLIDVRVAGNVPFISLSFNGKDYGKQKLSQYDGYKFTADYQIPYEEGELVAIGYDNEGNEIAKEIKHSFGETKEYITESYVVDDKVSTGLPLMFVEISAVDKDGYLVENDNSLVQIDVEGQGVLAGLDNGDSTDEYEYKGNKKHLFSGKMLAVIEVNGNPDDIKLNLSRVNDINWIRKIKLEPVGERNITEKCREIELEAVVCPENAGDNKLEWTIINDAGAISPIAEIAGITKTKTGEIARIKGNGDGNCRVRCMSRNGQRVVKVISEYELCISGLGQATLNPYELIKGALYTRGQGNIGTGIELGVSTADERTVIAFDRLDFGDYGSDEITIPLYDLGGDKYDVEIWQGFPGEEDCEMLLKTVYQHRSPWLTYIHETFKLPRRIKGTKTISLVFNKKIDIGGIVFRKYDKAFSEINAGESVRIYGDTFTESGEAVLGIGNNVNIEFDEIDFGSEGASKITITGHTPKPVNTIHIIFDDGNKESREIIEFKNSPDVCSVTFDIAKVTGKNAVRFVFLPGSEFDFYSFMFKK